LQKKTRIQDLLLKKEQKVDKYKETRHRGHDDSHRAMMGKLSHQARCAYLIYF
jgi:hypothetical protein